MIEKSLVESIVIQELDSEKEFLVDMSISTGNKILILIDADDGITIDRCVKVSRAVEQSLNRDEEDFELEVSSAGLSSPLKLTRQYVKNIGRDLSIVLTTGIKVEGKLLAANETTFTIEFEELVAVEGKKRKQKEVKNLDIPYTDVKSAFIAISFR